jgi:serine/threonine-protein kinase RsbW
MASGPTGQYLPGVKVVVPVRVWPPGSRGGWDVPSEERPAVVRHRSGREVAVGEPGPPLLRLELEAGPRAPSSVRRALRACLADLEVPEDMAADMVLAVDEAVSNAVDHAYLGRDRTGHLVVVGEVRDDAAAETDDDRRRLRVTVSDFGSWRPIPADPGHRGRGLLMMSECAASASVVSTDAGTQVTLISPPFEDPAADEPA